MNSIAQQHNLHIHAQARDFILVITQGGQIESLRIRDILDIQPAHEKGLTLVWHLVDRKQERLRIQLLIQESASAFWNRCLDLLEALNCKDEDAINLHFAPRVQ